MFKRNVQKFIKENELLEDKDRILVALSGGADSVALIRVLLSLNYSCECAHCNFHLRGEESDRDEKFVRSLCQKLSIPLHVIHFETETYAQENHLSIEMAARKLRYEWFELLRDKRDLSAIAVAHHLDDSVETVVLNLIRGTGINGLKGINPKNGYIVRPLLNEKRDDILEYLCAIQQDYVTDSTNLQDEYIRNKIRLNIIPLMKEINPSVIDNINETSMRLREAAAIYNNDREKEIKSKLLRISNDSFRLSINSVLNDIAPKSLLYEILSPLGFNSAQTKDIFKCLLTEQSGKRFYSYQWEVLRDRDTLFIQSKNIQTSSPVLNIEEIEKESNFKIPNDKNIAYIDADKVTLPLTIRLWKHGDKFVPLGMTGKKKISDYLTDKKYTIHQKEKQYVVCSNEDIVWLVNERIDNRFCITEKTKRILKIHI